MKTLIMLSAFLLALSSCTKEMPDPDPDPAPDPGDGDPDDGDSPSGCSNNNPGKTITWVRVTS